MRRILIIGASGLIGGNCLSYFKRNGYEVIGTHLNFETKQTQYFNPLEPVNPANFDVQSFHPEVVLLAGALSWVDYCEDHVDESYSKTVESCKNVIGLCKDLNSKLVYISTDYVFDGKDGPYPEYAATNPISIYGKHKLEAE
ncbi:MAG: sugar nucleotide-binding protein, partial [Melioribacteraceae bacterium]|nr:sugar nucleotide-binding protein [Melioribacteraceae bacterium]